MTEEQAPKIVIIGCGNVAWHLAKKFYELKFRITVYNHRASPELEEFRHNFQATARVGLHNIEKEAAFYFICVPDRYISTCAKKISPVSPRAVVAHTSGTASISELGDRGHGTAVFYPLQTFSRHDEIYWQDLPIIIEGDSEATTEQVKKLAIHLSRNVKVYPEEDRVKLHLCAVLINNFGNALFTAAARLLADDSGQNKLSLLMPLARQTVQKVEKLGPRAAQTGPARRGDKKTIKKHLKMLNDEDELRKLYKQFSSIIISQHK